MGRLLCVAAVAAVTLLRSARGAIPAHKVTHLPGLDGPLKSEMYSGYLPVGKTSGVKGMIHYWLIMSEGDPKTDPIAYWTNGGPGASGISDGLLTEMGQIHVDDRSFNKTDPEAPLKVFYNPMSWSKVANMLYVSQPKGVGFSYCVDDAGEPVENPEATCINTDLSAAQDGYDFFVNFFAAYPEFKNNDFFLTAESYGGTYIPMMMDQIDTRGGLPNFRGAAIGDGCWGNEVGTCAFSSGKAKQIKAEFFQGHGMYDQVLYGKIKHACGDFSDEATKRPICALLLDEMNAKVGQFDVYNIYDLCGNDRSEASSSAAPESVVGWLKEIEDAMSTTTVTIPRKHANTLAAAPHPQLESTAVGGALNDYPCGGERAASAWLAQSDVQAALHVKSDRGGMSYHKGPMNISGDLRPLYKKLISKYRMLIYSGDTDACVPYWGSQEWTRELGFPVAKAWRPWQAAATPGGDLQRAGYAIDYESGTGFKYVTVQGAGHMVPTYKPGFALALITKFFNNETF